jgi:hypothetical protein
MDTVDAPDTGSGLTVVFVGPLLACFEQLACAARRNGVRTVWIGYPYSRVCRLRARMFVNQVLTAYDVDSLAAALRTIGPDSITDIQASEQVLSHTVAAAARARVDPELQVELERRLHLGDKLVMSLTLAAAGVRVPRALDASNLTATQAVTELGLPMVVKGRLANSGATVHIVHSVAEATRASAAVARYGGPMYEQFVPGRTLSYVASYSGGGHVLHEGVYLSSRVGHDEVAPPDHVVTLDRPLHRATGRTVLGLVGGSGLVNMNLIEDDQGQGWVHDVNMRPWGTVVALRRAGVDFADDYVRIHSGRLTDAPGGLLPPGEEVDVFPSAVLGTAQHSLPAAFLLWVRLLPRYLRWTGPGYVLAESVRSAVIIVRDRWRSRRRPRRTGTATSRA